MGELELDATLTSRDYVNTKLRQVLDEATDKWGIKVNRVELKNINPPHDIQQAMEKQMRAERENEKRSCGLKARRQQLFLRPRGRNRRSSSRQKPSGKPRLRRPKESSRLPYCGPRVKLRLFSMCRRRLPTAW